MRETLLLRPHELINIRASSLGYTVVEGTPGVWFEITRKCRLIIGYVFIETENGYNIFRENEIGFHYMKEQEFLDLAIKILSEPQ